MEAEKQIIKYKAPAFIISGIEKMLIDRQDAVSLMNKIQQEDNRHPDPTFEHHKRKIMLQIDELQEFLYFFR